MKRAGPGRQSLLRESEPGREVRRMCRKGKKKEERVDGNAPQVAEVFREEGGNGADFLGNFLISEH